MQAQSATEKHKVVVNLKDGTVVKGYLETTVPTDLASLLQDPLRRFPNHLRLLSANGSGEHEIDVTKAKAVFFVRSFEGDKKKNPVRFYANGPAVHGIWVEIRFHDGETVEGVVHNSIHHLIEDGFLLSPSDPDSNNEVIYVVKSSIQNYRVLGVRTVR
jgi:hypothetical protein